MQRIKNSIWLLSLGVISMGNATTIGHKSLFVCYGKIDPEVVKGYKLVVLEPAHYNKEEVACFKENNLKVVGYFSTTEVNTAASYYNEVRDYTIDKNNNWNSYFLDIAESKVQEVLLGHVRIIMEKGFHGLFLDTLDNTSKWGSMLDNKKDVIQFIKTVFKQNPNIYLVQNGGIFLLNETQNYIESVVVESVLSNYDFLKKSYELRDYKDQKNRLESLKKIISGYSKEVFVIEYANTEKTLTKLASFYNKKCYNYFIANIDLQKVPEFNNK